MMIILLVVTTLLILSVTTSHASHTHTPRHTHELPHDLVDVFHVMTRFPVPKYTGSLAKDSLRCAEYCTTYLLNHSKRLQEQRVAGCMYGWIRQGSVKQSVVVVQCLQQCREVFGMRDAQQVCLEGCVVGAAMTQAIQSAL